MDAFIGEIRAFPYIFIPQYWLPCDGTLYNIQAYQALYAILGTHYGGDGKNNFAVPNLNGQAVMGYSATLTAAGGPYAMGQTLGHSSVTLTTSQIPSHNHGMTSEAGTTRLPGPGASAVPLNPLFKPSGATRSYNLGMYIPATSNPTMGTMAPTAMANAGSSSPHENRSPLLVMRYFICHLGEWPARN